MTIALYRLEGMQAGEIGWNAGVFKVRETGLLKMMAIGLLVDLGKE